jgi:hypothetical protein
MQEMKNNTTGMEYNTGLAHMSISEYGRNVHRMIDHCLAISDKAERTRCAKTIVRVMAILNPQMKEFNDFEHKLWDHLHIMANFQLDVDAPFPKPEKAQLESKPERVPYPINTIKYRHYGKILEDLIRKAMNEQDPKNRQVFTEQLAQLMKKQYLNWNRDSVNDQLIVEQLDELSKSSLKVSENFRFLHTSEILPKNAIPQNQVAINLGLGKKKKKKKR